MIRRPLPREYQYLEPYVGAILRDSPFDRNVFVMVRYAETPSLRAIREATRRALSANDFTPLLAMDRAYHPQLWENTCAYMLASRLGLAIFEDVESQDYNPNIAIELGFMTALGRRCLPLKEKHMPALPVDIRGLLYKNFDRFDIQESISKAIKSWVESDLFPGSELAERIQGYYTSEWSWGSEPPNLGVARIEGQGNEVMIVVHDEGASTFGVPGRMVGPHEIVASWLNVDEPADYGAWTGRVSEDRQTIEGDWQASGTGTRGKWRLERLEEVPEAFRRRPPTKRSQKVQRAAKKKARKKKTATRERKGLATKGRFPKRYPGGGTKRPPGTD